MAVLAHEQIIPKLNQIIPRYLNIVLIIAGAFVLAKIIWLMVPTDHFNRPAPYTAAPQESIDNTQNRSASSFVNQINQYNIFGMFKPKKAIKPKPKPSNVVEETRLPLILNGVYSLDKKNALAIITSSGQQHVVKVGDQIEGNGAILTAVEANRVILSYQGKKEFLTMFDVLEGSKHSNPPPNNNSSNQYEYQRPQSNTPSSYYSNSASSNQFQPANVPTQRNIGRNQRPKKPFSEELEPLQKHKETTTPIPKPNQQVKPILINNPINLYVTLKMLSLTTTPKFLTLFVLHPFNKTAK